MRRSTPLLATLFLALQLLSLTIVTIPQKAAAATLLAARYDKISSSVVSTVAIHQIGFTMTETSTPIGSVSIEFCSNTPIIEDPCTFPAGFSASSVSLTAQSGETGFSVHPLSSANRVVLTRPASNPSGAASVYDLSNITNPSNTGTYFVRYKTFTSTDATGIEIQNGAVVIYMNNTVTVNAEVPPYLTFCVAITITAFDCSTGTEFFIDFGNFLTSTTSHATSQFLAASNATSGYSVTMTGTTLTSGLNTIPGLATPTNSSTGTSQFGMNLRQNSIPSNGTNPVGPGTAAPSANYNIPNQYTFNNGDIIASVTHSDDVRKFTVNYITNVSSSQAGGVYATTISFICLANF